MDINTSYDAAMRSVIPGTFVPDLGSGNAPASGPIPDTGVAAAGGMSFKDTVKSFLADVNDKVNTSDQLSNDLATGKTNDVNSVVTSVEEANLAMEYTISIRNKLLQAYQEISQMQM